MAASALAVGLLAIVPLGAQTAHYGTVLTLGSGFVTPTGVAVDQYGNVFVADNGNSAVKEIVAVNGNIPASPTINTLGSGFANPFTVSVDAKGNVYLTDYGNHAVKEIEAVNGSIPPSPTIRTLASGLTFIFGSAVDSKGDVFYTEYGRNEVKEIVAVNGTIPPSPRTLVLGSGFNIPAGVAVDSSGNVFIGDQNNNALKEILASSGYTTVNTLATGFSTPDGIAIDQAGNAYVANDGANLVDEVMAVNGVIPPSPTITSLGSGFSQPFDVAVDKLGNIYVADRGNNAVKEIQVAGINFGSVNLGFISSSVAVNFTFDTAGTLGSTAVLTQGASSLDFIDAGGDTCVGGTAYSVGQSCTVNVIFAPTAPGPRLGAVELLSSSGAVLATGYVQGTGVAPLVTYGRPVSGTILPTQTVSLGSGFSSPDAVAMDGMRNVFVADNGTATVKEILAAGGYSTVNTLGGFTSPNGVAVDGAGNVFVADTFSNTIKEIVAAGGYSTINILGSGFSNPYAVAVDGSGNVYVADFSNNAVKEMIAVNGVIPATPTIRTLGTGFSGPDGVTVDPNGNVFVASYNTGNIDEIEAVNGVIPAAPTIRNIGVDFGGPANMSSDASGNIYFVDADDGLAYEIVASASGAFVALNDLGSGFSSPQGVAVDARGDLIVADALNNTVQLLDYTDAPSLSFATTTPGSTSSDSPQTVNLSNIGNAALDFSALTYPTDFPEATGVASDCKGSTMAASGACTLSIDFTPKSSSLSGSSTGLSENVAVTTNSLNATTAQAVAVSGVVITPSAVLVSPTPNATLAGPNVTFTWTTGTGATGYALWIGSSAGTSNIYATPVITATSRAVTGLPTNGEVLYLRLFTSFNGTLTHIDYTFTAATSATMSSPTPATTLAGPNVTFSWTAGTGATGYALWIGTSAGTSNLFGTSVSTATSAAPTGLPTNGQTLYVRLFTSFNGTLTHTDYTYTAATSGAMSSPAPGTMLTSPNVTFSWTAGTGATGYALWIGTSPGTSNILGTGTLTTTSKSVTGLPTNGETLYVRLFTSFNGVLAHTDYTYTAQ